MNDKTKRLAAQEAKFKAHECRELAQRTTRQRHRVMLQHMAETWERVAHETETEN